MNHSKPELLAPAGGMEQLAYAIHFGADAVYLACDKFGLRTRASNFSLEELPQAVAYAHNHGVKVHVTCNVYAHDADIAQLPAYAQAIQAAGVDAVIVSDLGVLAVIREHAPAVEVHVSTQASVSNAAAARVWYELGARRVVCAREMSLAEIAAMKRELPSDMQLEVFVHGAMCMAISGRCLISDHLTGRAANQGNCVQPCRWRYDLVEESRPDERFGIEEDSQGTYLMNSKDLNMLRHIPELLEAQVDSVKIEGRVKKAFYVATVVNAYRHVLDGKPAGDWAEELEKMSHRPYSTGFFFGDAEQTDNADSYVQLNDWVGEVRGCEPLPDGHYRVVVRCRNRFREGEILELLSPDAPVAEVKVDQLAELFGPSGEEVLATTGSSSSPEALAEVWPGASLFEPVATDVANKGMHLYAITTSMPLRPRDILRSTRIDPSRKN